MRVEPPSFMRHDHEKRAPLRGAGEVEFEGAAIEPDQKRV